MFKQNPLVRRLLDWSTEHGGPNLNSMIETGTNDDWNQFAQLIGYSVSGFGDLGYCDPKTLDKADRAAEKLIKRKERKK